MNAGTYAIQLRRARQLYDSTGDGGGYIADCIYIAAKMGAAELAEENPRLAYLSTSLTVASPAFKAAIEEVIHHFSCPVAAGYSHRDFLYLVARNARRHIDRDYPIVGKIMTHMGI